jgi:hypothetical protein
MEENNKVPFTKEEQEVMDNLTKAWNAFCKLYSTHPSHNADFCDGIHKCQDVIIHRVVQRDYPSTFPTYNYKPSCANISKGKGDLIE